MVFPSTGEIVTISFPFSDLSNSKLRPALVLARAGKNDFILCQITSNPYSDLGAIELPASGFKTGGLSLTSYIRPGKLFTANASIIHNSVGSIKPEILKASIDAVVHILQAQP